MSRSFSAGKRRHRHIRSTPHVPNGADTVMRRICWGSTHRVRHRNRQLWARALGKLRRAHDRRVTAESGGE